MNNIPVGEWVSYIEFCKKVTLQCWGSEGDEWLYDQDQDEVTDREIERYACDEGIDDDKQVNAVIGIAGGNPEQTHISDYIEGNDYMSDALLNSDIDKDFTLEDIDWCANCLAENLVEWYDECREISYEYCDGTDGLNPKESKTVYNIITRSLKKYLKVIIEFGDVDDIPNKTFNQIANTCNRRLARALRHRDNSHDGVIYDMHYYEVYVKNGVAERVIRTS